MLKASLLSLIAAFAWYMAVWHIAQGRGWLPHQRFIVFWGVLFILVVTILYIMRS